MLRLPKHVPVATATILIVVAGWLKLPETPKVSEILKAQLIQYLKDAGKLSTQPGGCSS